MAFGESIPHLEKMGKNLNLSGNIDIFWQALRRIGFPEDISTETRGVHLENSF